jgi:hypothetical protein
MAVVTSPTCISQRERSRLKSLHSHATKSAATTSGSNPGLHFIASPQEYVRLHGHANAALLDRILVHIVYTISHVHEKNCCILIFLPRPPFSSKKKACVGFGLLACQQAHVRTKGCILARTRGEWQHHEEKENCHAWLTPSVGHILMRSTFVWNQRWISKFVNDAF